MKKLMLTICLLAGMVLVQGCRGPQMIEAIGGLISACIIPGLIIFGIWALCQVVKNTKK